jgi:tetratricopeptide (TPR) repeat protein
MPELLREPVELRRRIETLEQDRPAGKSDDEYWEALAEACFRLAVHHTTPVLEATALLQRAAKIDGSNPKYPYHLGRIFLSHGRLDLARKWLSAAAKLCPTSHRIWTHISLLQRELNERFRTDQTVLQDDLRKRAEELAGHVKDGADRVDESLLEFDPRKRAGAQRPDDQAAAAAGPAKSESGDGKPESTTDVRRVQNAGRCRWSGVIDLQAEQSLEAAPRQETARLLLALLAKLRATAGERKGGPTGLVVLAVDWLVRGYPVSTIRQLIEELQTPATDPCLELLAICCALVEADEAELPQMLADCVRGNTVPPLLAAVIHERRLLWSVPQLQRLGAVCRKAERLLDRIERVEGDGQESRDALRERAGAMTELLDRVTRELDRKPPAALEAIIEERGGPGSETDDTGHRFQELGREAEALETQVGVDWQQLKELIEKNEKGPLDEADLAVAAAISERIESMLARCGAVIKYLEETKRSGALESKEATQELERLKQAYLKLKRNKGRFGPRLEGLRLPKVDEPAPADGPAVAPERLPTDPVELLAHRLRTVENRIREVFDSAETTFAPYSDGALQLAPIKTLRRGLRARKAEALYRLGRRQEARRIWVAMLREDPLDASAAKNVAVCDSVRRDMARHLQSWKSYIELLYYFDIVACDPRPHARERAEFHRDFAGAYAPRFLAEEKVDPEKVDITELSAFLTSPRLAVFMGHKLLEIMNERLAYNSPPIILGIDRSAREEAREQARNNTQVFVRTVGASLPDRIREAFCDILRNHIDAAFEATASARRLTLKQDPYYSEEKKRYAKWLTEFGDFKIRLFNVTAHHLRNLLELPTLEWMEQLRILDSVPIGNSPEFLQQHVKHPDQVPGLMGSLENAAVRAKQDAVKEIKEHIGEPAFTEILERWIGRLAGTPGPDPHPLLRELDALHRILNLVQRRLDREREARAAAEGRESADRDISADEAEEFGKQVVGAIAQVFLSPFIGKFNEIMEQAQAGIETDSQARRIESQLEPLRRTVAALEPLIGTDEDYRKLAEAIDSLLGNLQARPETEIVNALAARYTELLKTATPPLSRDEVKRLRSEMLKLKKDVADCRGKVHGADAMKGLDELSAAIDGVLTQLEG